MRSQCTNVLHMQCHRIVKAEHKGKARKLQFTHPNAHHEDEFQLLTVN